MAVQALMTAAEFDALPEEEGRKWELLDGELIEVSSATPKHNLILLTLAALLKAFSRQHHLGTVLPETDLAVGPATRLRPDLSYFRRETWQSVDVDRVPVIATPDIAIEIISPSETATTVERKVKKYLGWGVREVWLLYPEIRVIYTHVRNGAQRLSEGAFLTSDLIPGFNAPVDEIFDIEQA
jgi:Uma2 family endonuclease